MQVMKIALNDDISADKFKLEQPSGSELVRVGDAAENKTPETKPLLGKPQ